MADRRLTPANERVASIALKGVLEAATFVTPQPRTVAAPVADICASPNGRRDRQVLWGQEVKLLEDHNGWSFVQATADSYVGYIRSVDLQDEITPTYRVAVPATHIYPEPNFKTRESHWLSLGSEVRVISEAGRFSETTAGYIPRSHLRPISSPFSDPVTVAQMLFGVPYLWGGNSAAGIDCSGLVQMACHAAGQPCPGDSDLQEIALGQTLPRGSDVQRGDLFFWKGHVAWAVDENTLIHANAHHMAVAYEPIAQAIQRIEAQGDGPVTAHKRL